jgi:peptidoglycan/LPS O-acetylase OafA/YrhL
MFSKIKHRRDIQVFRGLAVLAVVLFHAEERYFPLGYLGVDVFFVISGFVVTPLILRIFTDQAKGNLLANLRDFYRRRFYRLAPALAVTLIISAVTIFLLGPIVDHQRFARQGIATLLLAGNFGAYRYSGEYFSPNPNPLVHTWSLSVEEQIYIFLPLVLILFLRNHKSPKNTTAIVLGVISVLSFASFLFPAIFQPLYSLAGSEVDSQFSFYSPIDRVWQFAAGGLVFLLLDRYQNRARSIPKSIHLLNIIIVVMILFGPLHMNLKVSSILATLFTVIVIQFNSLDLLPKFLFKRLEWVGDRSYSIYLVHMPLLYLAKYSLEAQIGKSENRVFQSVIAVIASVLLGALSYSKIENRYRNRGKSSNTGLKTITSALILTLATPLVFFMIMDRGVKNQYWGIERKILQPAYAGYLDPKCARDSELGPPCVYTNTGATQTVLLIGDSHAGHISQAVIDSAKRVNWNAVVWTHGGCRVKFTQTENSRVSEDCLDINNQMKRWVLQNKPDVIIFSQFLLSNIPQNEYRSALLTLQSIVPRILLIENTPVFPDKKHFMQRRLSIMPSHEAPKKFTQSQMQFKDKNASNLLAMWARRNGISTMDFTPIFCTEKSCSRFSNGLWLYHDGDHLSVAGAELTIPQIEKFLKQF